LRHGLPWKSLPKLLKRRILDLRKLCEHVHLSLLQCLLSLLPAWRSDSEQLA
jgi:hypothetical protein